MIPNQKGDGPLGSCSRMAVWRHEGLYSKEVRKILVASDVLSGPKDEDIYVLGIGHRIEPDAENDFLPLDVYGRVEDFATIDAVHTFAIVRQVLTMYRRAVARVDGADRARKIVDWYWNKSEDGLPVDRTEREPLAVYPRFGPGTGGYYSRKHKQLEFEYFNPALFVRDLPQPESGASSGMAEDRVFVCRSFDVVAHETGHAVLDGLRRGKTDPLNLEAQALHEAFADLTAVFAALSQLGQCERLIVQSKGRLLEYNPVNVIGRTIGHALFGRTNGLRNLVEKVPIEEAGEDPHRLAQSFAGAVYRCIARMFVLYQRREWLEPAETLLRVARHLMEVVLNTYRHAECLTFEVTCKTLRRQHEHRLQAPVDIAFLGDRVASSGILEEELLALETYPVPSTVSRDEPAHTVCYGTGR